LITAVGLLTAFVCVGYVLADWASLIAAYAQFQRLSSSGVDLRALFVADAVQNVHRLNCFAEGLGVLIGLLIAALGLHGLCLLAPRGDKGDAG